MSLKSAKKILINVIIVGAFILSDYLIASLLSQKSSGEAEAFTRAQAEYSAKTTRHIKICALTEKISRLAYDSGVAMGGYSITKDRLFYNRFKSIELELPKKVSELQKTIADEPDELPFFKAVSDASSKIIANMLEAKALIDNPKTTNADLNSRHTYKITRQSADELEDSITALRQKDISSIQIHSVVQSQSHIGNQIQLSVIALFNAICGCFVGIYICKEASGAKQEIGTGEKI